MAEKLRVRIVDDVVTTNTAGGVAESLPVLVVEGPVQNTAGTWVDPIEMEEADDGVPIRIVTEAVVLNSAGQPVAAIPGEGVGGDWWPSGALWSADYVNSRFRDSDGNLYTSKAAFNAAMGISEAGEARSFTPVITGAEEFPDPGCTSVTGWTGLSTTPSIVSDRLRATSTISGSGARSAYKTLTTLTADQGYIAGCDVAAVGGTAGGASLIRPQARTTGDATIAEDASATALTTRQFGFAASGASVRLATRYDNSGGATDTYVEYDNFTVKAGEPYKGHTRGTKSLRITVETPGSVPSTQVLAMWGVSGSTYNTQTAVRLELRTDWSLHLVANRFNVAQADLNLGTVGASEEHEIKLALTANRISASLDGDPIITDTSCQVPGAAFFWLGRSFTGEAFGGTILSVDVWAEALSDAALVSPFKAMVIWGDSLAAATGASTAAAAWYNQLAATLGWTVVSKGNGGDTATAVETRFDAESEPAYRSWLNIFINRPNGLETFEQFMGPHERMVGSVGRAFFVPPLLNSASGSPDTNAGVIEAVQAELLTARWAGRTLDAAAQAAFQTAMNDDATRVGGGDWTHFDDSGHDIVDTTVGDGLAAVGLAA